MIKHATTNSQAILQLFSWLPAAISVVWYGQLSMYARCISLHSMTLALCIGYPGNYTRSCSKYHIHGNNLNLPTTCEENHQ
mmetsp:Transcript_6556/g.10214  ORF Transcript_6556/g.10214 Transcript_6556/m.10214 type:complete len:81 (+) Transcript_6556:378-620(+)